MQAGLLQDMAPYINIYIYFLNSHFWHVLVPFYISLPFMAHRGFEFNHSKPVTVLKSHKQGHNHKPPTSQNPNNHNHAHRGKLVCRKNNLLFAFSSTSRIGARCKPLARIFCAWWTWLTKIMQLILIWDAGARLPFNHRCSDSHTEFLVQFFLHYY